MPEKKQITYSKEFKEEAVRLYLEGAEGYKKLTKRLGLTSTARLRDWVAKAQRGESLEDGRGKHRNSRKGRSRTRFDSLEEKLAYVEAERDYLKKLYRSRFGHEWGAHIKDNSSK